MRDIIVSGDYKLCPLGREHFAAVSKLSESCSDYYLLHYGTSACENEVTEIFEDLPPNKGYEDKFVLGVFSCSGRLVGVIDIVRSYPVEGEWMLGLMLLDPQERGRALGKAVHTALISWAKELGAKSFRIGVIEENRGGLAFWSTLGYTKLKEVSMVFKDKTHIVNVMTLKLSE